MTKDQIIKELRVRIAELETELAKFKRGGRKPLGAKAMTNAERQRRKYAKKKAAAKERKDT